MRKAVVVAQVLACLATTVGGAAYAQERGREGRSEAESRVEARLRAQSPGRDTQRVWKLESSRWLGQSRSLKWQADDTSVLLHYTLHESAAAAKAALRSDVNSINGGIVVSIDGVGDEAFLTNRDAILFRRGRLTAIVRAPDTPMAYKISAWLLAELNREHLGSGDKDDPDLP